MAGSIDIILFTAACVIVAAIIFYFNYSSQKQKLKSNDATLKRDVSEVSRKTVGTISKRTREEVSRHNNEKDAWIIVDGKVYDITSYITSHPGGDSILNNVGDDSSEGFHGPQHPPSALDVLAEFYIGDLQSQ